MSCDSPGEFAVAAPVLWFCAEKGLDLAGELGVDGGHLQDTVAVFRVEQCSLGYGQVFNRALGRITPRALPILRNLEFHRVILSAL